MSDQREETPGDGAGDGQAGSKWALPRWAIFAMIPGVAMPVLILAFILRVEFAHDEGRCPFAEVGRRALDGGVAVVEQARSCLPDVQERRFVVVRGQARTIVGSRRFAPAAFGEGYSWRAELSEEGEVSIHLVNPGHPDRSFREGTAADETAWQDN